MTESWWIYLQFFSQLIWSSWKWMGQYNISERVLWTLQQKWRWGQMNSIITIYGSGKNFSKLYWSWTTAPSRRYLPERFFRNFQVVIKPTYNFVRSEQEMQLKLSVTRTAKQQVAIVVQERSWLQKSFLSWCSRWTEDSHCIDSSSWISEGREREQRIFIQTTNDPFQGICAVSIFGLSSKSCIFPCLFIWWRLCGEERRQFCLSQYQWLESRSLLYTMTEWWLLKSAFLNSIKVIIEERYSYYAPYFCPSLSYDQGRTFKINLPISIEEESWKHLVPIWMNRIRRFAFTMIWGSNWKF